MGAIWDTVTTELTVEEAEAVLALVHDALGRGVVACGMADLTKIEAKYDVDIAAARLLTQRREEDRGATVNESKAGDGLEEVHVTGRGRGDADTGTVASRSHEEDASAPTA